jgi:hypothetical protein
LHFAPSLNEDPGNRGTDTPAAFFADGLCGDENSSADKVVCMPLLVIAVR